MPLLEDIQQILAQGLEKLHAATQADALEQWRIKFLGTKGAVKAAMGRLKEVPKEQKRAAGQAANELKNALTEAFERQRAKIATAGGSAKKTQGQIIDVTLPGKQRRIGHTHVITQTINEICEIFARMGFAVATGPEVEDDRHNFEALNIPLSHPARDPLDNFYINPEVMLRSQTSTVQIRTMENTDPPVRIISPGRVYRPDTVDATHSFMFHQVEGLFVDEGVTMADLKTCLDQFCKTYFGSDIVTCFRPSFFPFTEPSAEVDIEFNRPDGTKYWVEVGGCGMVDPNVLDGVGYDTEKYTGFAFGLGIERLIMRKHRIPDIRLLFESDKRFLHQF
jgi:phenylalanyl-tRNA synthetase alpha chain